MADDETTDETTDETEEAKAPKEPRGGVAVPAWALAVVAALAVGGIGYAIGQDNNDSQNLINPIADMRSAPGDNQSDGGTRGACPSPFGGHDGGQHPGPGGNGPGGNGPGGMPGGPLGPGFGPGGPNTRDQRGDQDENQDENNDEQDPEPDQDEESSSV